ncbi:MAG: efflux RND transporter periplasmic adaptor subunit [Gammaproteobacteria bacterium]|nr:MAG: efflux RND transporter periplasmic adaptor subunit [Gammaproteobacteria bacterium]
MTTTGSPAPSRHPAQGRHLLPFLLGLGVIALSAVVLWRILQPATKSTRPVTALTQPVVEVLDATPGQHAIRIHAWGRVSEEDVLELFPQVEGQLRQIHRELVPGGFVPAGEPLAEIDPSDYRLGVKAAEAGLAKAEARLAVEQARRKLAGKELRMLEKGKTLDERSRALVLREPQLREARAEVAEARHALEKARLALARTRLSLPFEVRVLERDHQVPEVVGPGRRIARLQPTAAVTVRLLINTDGLPRLRRVLEERPGAEVEILANGYRYSGTLETIGTALSAETRQVPIRVRVSDPFGRKPSHHGRPPLLLGSLVEAWIPAGALQETVAVPRPLLQDNRRVWVVDGEGRLRVRKVDIRFREPERVFIAPLPAGDRLLRGNPAGLAPGTRVEVRETS